MFRLLEKPLWGNISAFRKAIIGQCFGFWKSHYRAIFRLLEKPLSGNVSAFGKTIIGQCFGFCKGHYRAIKNKREGR
jgi:hypothetical protein